MAVSSVEVEAQAKVEIGEGEKEEYYMHTPNSYHVKLDRTSKTSWSEVMGGDSRIQTSSNVYDDQGRNHIVGPNHIYVNGLIMDTFTYPYSIYPINPRR